MKKQFIFSMVGIVLLAAASTGAQGFWDKKEWQKWSKDDCKKMMEDSPWARKWVQSTVQTAQFSSRDVVGGTGSSSGGAGADSRLEVWYVVQLRSSQPIREAAVRSMEIQAKYENMNEQQRAGVDKQVANILGQKYEDVVIIHVYYGSNNSTYDRELATFWQTTYPSGTVPLEAFLNTANGKKLPAIRFNAPRGGANEFELIFPRLVDGEAVLTPTAKTLSVEFHSPQIPQPDRTSIVTQGIVPEGRVFIEFKPEKMQYHGTLSY